MGSFLPETCSASLYIGSNVAAFQVTQRGVTQLLCSVHGAHLSGVSPTHTLPLSKGPVGSASIMLGLPTLLYVVIVQGLCPAGAILCAGYSAPGNLFISIGPTLISGKAEIRLSNENSYWFICLVFYFNIVISLQNVLGKHKRNVSSVKCN